MGFLAGKKALIVGVASQRSIATGIAQAMHREGAELAFTYQNDKLKGRVESFAAECGSSLSLPCDVSDDTEIDAVAARLSEVWGSLDVLVHSVGFAPAHELDGNYADIATREGFAIAHDISSYSLTALTRACKPLMGAGASVLTLTYLGADRVLPNYNVMGLAKASLEANVRYLAASLGPDGIRVNGISAGPIKTLAAAGIKQFRNMLAHNANTAPLRRNVSVEEVGNAGAFLCSDLASGITGEILFVDAGYNIMGMGALE